MQVNIYALEKHKVVPCRICSGVATLSVRRTAQSGVTYPAPCSEPCRVSSWSGVGAGMHVMPPTGDAQPTSALAFRAAQHAIGCQLTVWRDLGGIVLSCPTLA
jgi:hypothetical protein